MNARLRALLAAVALALVAGLTDGARGTPDRFPVERAKTPRSLLTLQNELYRARRWADLWQAYSPRFRRRCAFESWSRKLAAQWAGTRASRTTAVRVRIRGPRALVTYRIVSGGKVTYEVRASEPDVYVKLGTRWYDDIDRHTRC